MHTHTLGHTHTNNAFSIQYSFTLRNVIVCGRNAADDDPAGFWVRGNAAVATAITAAVYPL